MSKVSTGSRLILKIGGSKVAFASDFNYTINHELQKIDVLDQLTAAEYAEVGYDVSFTCSTFRVSGKSAVALGIQPKIEDILTQPELIAEGIDRVTGKTLIRITGIKLQSVSGGGGARAAMTETWSFIGLRATDET